MTPSVTVSTVLRITGIIQLSQIQEVNITGHISSLWNSLFKNTGADTRFFLLPTGKAWI